MNSMVITGQRFLGSNIQVSDFDKVYLAEGDSWMDASAAAQGSLPFYLAQEFNKRHQSRLIINISRAGDTLQDIDDTMQGEYVWWLGQQRFDGVLFSAGGNDYIDASRFPPPGQGLLKDMAGQPLPANGADCVRQDGVDMLDGFLNKNFGAMYEALRAGSKNPDTPMYLNCYDTPVARNAPALKGVGPWLYKAYTVNSIPPVLWPQLTASLFAKIQAVVGAWPDGRTGLTAVATTGLLTPADPNATGSSGDWKNEIHPNASGWKKQAKVWADVLG